MIVGDRKGKIGLGVAKGNDVTSAIRKAAHDAKKKIINVPIVGDATVPYLTKHKYKSAIIKLIPAASGTGLKAWSSVRMILELAGYNNILSKIMWTNNKLNNALATIDALKSYKHTKQEPTYKKNAWKDNNGSTSDKDAADKKKSPVSKAVAWQAVAKKPTSKKATESRPTDKTESAAKKTTKKKDHNLTKIEWVGPKIQELLENAGIKSFKDLADAKVDDLKKILADAGGRMTSHDPTTWPEQSALAASGDRDWLQKLQDSLDWGKPKA